MVKFLASALAAFAITASALNVDTFIEEALSSIHSVSEDGLTENIELAPYLELEVKHLPNGEKVSGTYGNGNGKINFSRTTTNDANTGKCSSKSSKTDISEAATILILTSQSP